MTYRTRILASLVFTMILTVPAVAYRREYAVTWQGQRKAGSEVCFYRGVRGDAFALFFTPGEVKCLSADAILDFPPGLIHAFARHHDGFTSMQRDFTVYDGPPNPERGYEKIETPLVRAGILDFANVVKTLGANQRLGVWIASSATSLGTFIPLVAGETTVLAPAETIVVPLRIENGLPSGVGEPVYLEPGERQPAVFKSQKGTSDVILWTHLDVDSTRDAHTLLQPPTITLKQGDQSFRPVAPLYTPESNILLIFRGVPLGKAALLSQGSMWQRITREVNVLAQPVTIEREAIPLVAAGNVEVRWSTEGMRPAVVECPNARTADVPLVRAGLLRCVIGSDGKKQCSTIAKMTAPYAAASSMTFDGVAAGSYSVIIEPPYGKRQNLAAEVAAARQTTLDVTFPSFNFFGTVKVNGKPVHARLIFSTGQAVSDSEGRYTATLAEDPRGSQIQIEPCEAKRTFRFIPATGPASNAVFDLDVRLTTLDVEVVDPGRRPVADASVYFTPVKEVFADGKAAIYFGSEQKQTDAEGRVVFDAVPEGFLVAACARHKEFMIKCSDPVDLKKLGDGPLVVQFDPVGMRGHVEGHTGYGVVAIVNAAGAVTERADLDADGAFRFHAAHSAPEHLIYLSPTRPLTVVALPLAISADLVVQVPSVPVLTFTVTVPNMRTERGYLGIWVGGMFVPVQVFNTYMEMRGLDSEVHRGTGLRVPDIAQAGPVTVAFGALPEGLKEFVDPFTLPQFAGVKRQRVEGPVVVLSE